MKRSGFIAVVAALASALWCGGALNAKHTSSGRWNCPDCLAKAQAMWTGFGAYKLAPGEMERVTKEWVAFGKRCNLGHETDPFWDSPQERGRIYGWSA